MNPPRVPHIPAVERWWVTTESGKDERTGA